MKYRALETISLFSGKISLSEKQASIRSTVLKPVKNKKGLYEIIGPVQFKRGETIDLIDPEKPILKSLECLEPPEEKKPDKDLDPVKEINTGNEAGKTDNVGSGKEGKTE